MKIWLELTAKDCNIADKVRVLLLVALEVSMTVLDTGVSDFEEPDTCELDSNMTEVVWPMDNVELSTKDEDTSTLVPEEDPTLVVDDVPEVRTVLTLVDDSTMLLVITEKPRLEDDPDVVDTKGPEVSPDCEILEAKLELKIPDGVLDVARVDPLEDVIDDAVPVLCMDVATGAEVGAILEVRGKVEKAMEVLDTVDGLVVELAMDVADDDVVDIAVDRLGVEVAFRLAKRLDAEADDELGAPGDTPTLSALMISAAYWQG